MRKGYCPNCEHRERIPGNAHIKCNDPPEGEDRIGAGGDERYKRAEELVNESGDLVVRCVWSGSGLFPLSFDSNTIFGCSNFKEVDPDE